MPPTESRPTDRPNIVLILVDDMGYSDIGCYGSEISTPHLDSLATGGIRFTQMYNCARCCPTRASILTGLYPHQAGVGDMVSDLGHPAYQGYLNDSCVTLAELLRHQGYRTLMTGKWHAGGFWPRREGPEWRIGDPTKPLPCDRGFDDWIGIPGGGSYFYPSPLLHNHRFVEPEDDFYTTDSYTNYAIDMVDQAVADGKPFFLHVCYNAPHWPLHAHEQDIAAFVGTYRNGWDHTRTSRHEELKGLGILDAKWDISPRDPNAPPWSNAPHHDWEDQRMAAYAGMVHCMDRNVGRLMAKLDQLGVRENTMVFFLSDNGGCAEFLAENGRKEAELPFTRDGRDVRVGNIVGLPPGGADTFQSYGVCWSNVSNSPFRLHKHWVHEGGISTPLIAHWPAGISTPGIVHSPSHITDISATILAVAGVNYPSEFEGRAITPLVGESFYQVFQGRSWQRSQPIFWEHENNCAMRDGQWKLVRRKENPAWELYDMSADRTELNDLAESEPRRVSAMAGEYQTWADHVGVVPIEVLRKRR